MICYFPYSCFSSAVDIINIVLINMFMYICPYFYHFSDSQNAHRISFVPNSKSYSRIFAILSCKLSLANFYFRISSHGFSKWVGSFSLYSFKIFVGLLTHFYFFQQCYYFVSIFTRMGSVVCFQNYNNLALIWASAKTELILVTLYPSPIAQKL